jgi:hypothetical protein
MNALVPMQDMDRMAAVFSKCGLFGQKTPDQCMALLLLAQAEGVHPAIAMRDFDVIQGKPAKKAEAMLRSFLAAGGSVEWHAMTDVLADATFSHPQGGKARLTWDLERVKKAGLGGKEMYAKYARQMLANRAISEGCRRIYPAATSGMYEPGEVRGIIKQEKDMGAAVVVPDESTGGIPSPSAGTAPPAASGAPVETRTETLLRLCNDAHMLVKDILAKAEVQSAEEISNEDWDSAVRLLKKKAAGMKGTA